MALMKCRELKLLNFNVKANSFPPSNIHTIIGRNGVGKTTLLNGMITCIIEQDYELGTFFDPLGFNFDRDDIISEDYFSSVVSVSFSAFDPFDPPLERGDPSLGACYYYIGLKKTSGDIGTSTFKSLDELRDEFVASLGECFIDSAKKKRWLSAIELLSSDPNFSEMNLHQLTRDQKWKLIKKESQHLISKMSSGHAIVILTITKLIEKVEEKTLVIIDEPETHLHPPLLSAFTRALSNLLYDRNGVAIIATHSPVVLQEVPKNCVWKVSRCREQMNSYRPEQETFAENVGILTREVFGLEVSSSGFHRMLKDLVNDGMSYKSILNKYDHQIGNEGRALVRAMLLTKKAD